MSKRLCLWAIGVAAVLIAQGARANERVVPATQRLGKLDTPAATVKDWLSQTPLLTQITGIKVNPTADEVEVILQTLAGTIPAAQLRTDGTTTIAEIPNAVLADGKPFQSEKPIYGITSITIEQLPGNRVKVAIVGQTAAPTAKIVSDTNRLIFSATPAQTTEGDIEITVRGNRTNSYRVPNASVTRTNTPIIDTPGSIQVIPRQIFQSQKPAKFSDALRSVAGAATNNTSRAYFTNCSGDCTRRTA